MGFAVVNLFGVGSFAAFGPLLLIYIGVGAGMAARWALTSKRPILLVSATVVGLATGGWLGSLTSHQPAPPTVAHLPWELAVAVAAEQVDLSKEDLAEYIDDNLPTIPELFHANCRELQDVLAARGLLCVDVGPDNARPNDPGPNDTRAYRLWSQYRQAKAKLDRLVEDGD